MKLIYLKFGFIYMQNRMTFYLAITLIKENFVLLYIKFKKNICIYNIKIVPNINDKLEDNEYKS